MASFRVEFAGSAEKDLRRCSPELAAKIVRRIEVLQGDPIPRQSQKLRGTERTYRLRVGDYRVIYEVEPGMHVIVIYYIRHRREAYRQLQRD
jgi:mRNA interferase RelE/StbE